MLEAGQGVNVAALISGVACVVGVLFALVTWSLASAPNTRGLRVFSSACFCGALYAAANGLLATNSYALSRWGVRLGLFFMGGHAAAWFVYTAQRENRRLSNIERFFVAGTVAWGLLSLVPNVLYDSDEIWIHAAPAMGVSYIDARSAPLGNLAFGFFACAVGYLLKNSLGRLRRTHDRRELAETIGLAALLVSGLNDSLVTADILHSIYLLDVGYLVLVAAVGSSLARRFVNDANDLAAAQAELVQRERLAAIGEMSAVVAHEVRNPVAIILNAATTMRRQGNEHATVQIIEEEAHRLSRMVTDLLDFARPTTLQFVEEPIGAIVESALDGLRKTEQDFAVELALPPRPVTVECDVRLTRQAVTNLVLNALQAPDRKRPVQVGITPDEEEQSVRIVVKDDGAGVPVELRERIFVPFFTTRATGTGLGLAVVHRIVQAHGGRVTCLETKGGGATFEVVLPIRREG